jgi:hypothetical protein
MVINFLVDGEVDYLHYERSLNLYMLAHMHDQRDEGCIGQ